MDLDTRSFQNLILIQELKYIQILIISMSESRQISVSKNGVSKLAIIALALVFVAGLFVVGFDQGHIFSMVIGEQAFADLYIHELTHDMRHAAGFPCH
jgi:hypothetical protein